MDPVSPVPRSCEACGSELLSERTCCVACRDRGRDLSWSTIKAADICGLSFRQVDYYARTGLVVPSVQANGSGSRRRYTYRDLVRLRLVQVTGNFGLAHVMTVRRVGLPEASQLDEGFLVFSEGSFKVCSEERLAVLAKGTTEFFVLPMLQVHDHLDRAIRDHYQEPVLVIPSGGFHG